MASTNDQIQNLDAELDALSTPTTAEVYATSRDYDADVVAASGVSRAINGVGGGGGGGIYGDGSDGDYSTADGEVPGLVELDGSNLTVQRDLFLDSLTVESGDSLYNKGQRIFARTSATIDGDLLASPGTPGGILGEGGTHGSGGDSGSPNGDAAPDHDFALGGDGGAGGDSGGNTGGAGGNTTAPPRQSGGLRFVPQVILGALVTPSPVDPDIGLVSVPVNGGAGGGGGASDGVNEAGDGTDGGGVLVLASPQITVSASGAIRANGRDGEVGSGGDTGGGGGGGGGLVLLTYNTLTNSGTIEAEGGAAGPGSGAGTDGQAGSPGTVITVANN